MLRNSQFSHILLLVVIGFAIYYLTSPSKENKPIKNVGTLESGDSNKNSDSENNSQVESEVVESPVEDKTVKEVAQQVEQDTEENSKGIISEVEEELENNFSENPTEQIQQQVAEQINSFKPNSTEGGANLDKAFNRPVAEGSQTNAINFNRNYLKSYDSKNYLPQEINDEWFDTDFTQAKNKLNSDDIITLVCSNIKIILKKIRVHQCCSF